ncbi:MAG: oxidoreductase [candidate division Zixibacteria bacterium RBG_16_53_22]|nr:MAG: oxidoreductase [candidate division Zixibacteria bacterium RBG_16_53_22]HJX12093.1 4Fe-4S dicluster domain-containing protein [Dehalococcoidales bacterium]
MDKWIFIIDVEACEDCNNCFLSCKDEYIDNDFPPYSIAQPKHGQRWMNIERKERGQCPMVDVAFLPTPCMHCDNAPCIKKAKNGAVYKSNNGIVIIDPDKARGQKDIVDACPYGAIWWNENKQVAQKCTMCVHLLNDGWKKPRCVQSCPTGALRFVSGEDSAIAQIIKDEKLEPLHPEYNAKPRVYYKNLYRFNRCFIGGTVAVQKKGVTDCVEGAMVTLYKDSEKVYEAITDNYGDFKFDNLEENSGKYRLEISARSYDKKTIEVDLIASINVGTIML